MIGGMNKMMIIEGIGNKGKKYENKRKNIGLMEEDEILRRNRF